MQQMGLVAVVMVMVAAVKVVAQLKGHKKSILQTLYHSWVIQIYLPVFHYNIVVCNSDAAPSNCCNLACSNQGRTQEVHIWFGSLGQRHSAQQTCE